MMRFDIVFIHKEIWKLLHCMSAGHVRAERIQDNTARNLLM